MLTLSGLRKNKELVNNIDWDIPPEKAVEMSQGLDNGSLGAKGSGEKIYFALLCQEREPQATLIKRDMKGVRELAKVCVPSDLFKEACKEDGINTSGKIHPLNDILKQWVATVLGDAPEHLH